jgi:DNA-directed RNA polymerase subunit L
MPNVNKVWKVISMIFSPDMFEWEEGEQKIKDETFKIELSNEEGQYCDILHNEINTDEGVSYAAIPFDSLSPGGLFEGDEINSRRIKVKISTDTDEEVQFAFFRAGYDISKGHAL